MTYDTQWNILTDRSLSGRQTANYIHGPATDEILAQIRDTGQFYPLTDALNSTIALADQTGARTAVWHYDAYGRPVSTGAASDYRYLYTGREWLSLVGLSEHRNRYYNPNTGRWLSRDSKYFDDSSNLYNAFRNSPANYSDPFGTSCSDMLLNAIMGPPKTNPYNPITQPTLYLQYESQLMATDNTGSSGSGDNGTSKGKVATVTIGEMTVISWEFVPEGQTQTQSSYEEIMKDLGPSGPSAWDEYLATHDNVNPAWAAIVGSFQSQSDVLNAWAEIGNAAPWIALGEAGAILALPSIIEGMGALTDFLAVGGGTGTAAGSGEVATFTVTQGGYYGGTIFTFEQATSATITGIVDAQIGATITNGIYVAGGTTLGYIIIMYGPDFASNALNPFSPPSAISIPNTVAVVVGVIVNDKISNE